MGQPFGVLGPVGMKLVEPGLPESRLRDHGGPALTINSPDRSPGGLRLADDELQKLFPTRRHGTGSVSIPESGVHVAGCRNDFESKSFDLRRILIRSVITRDRLIPQGDLPTLNR